MELGNGAQNQGGTAQPEPCKIGAICSQGVSNRKGNSMSREKMESYVFSGSEQLRRERDDLTRELMEWLTAKAAEGALPVPLRYALLNVADFAGGFGDDAEQFWLKTASTRQIRGLRRWCGITGRFDRQG